MEDLIRELLMTLGENPDRDGLINTPKRVTKAYRFLTEGYRQDPVEIVKNAMFEDRSEEMVLLKDIPVYSLCEHHMLPFYGRAHVAYIPSDKVVGISKLARVVDVFAKRLQLQERLTNQVANTLNDTLKPHGVAVVVEAEHLCMQMRGVQKRGTSMVTSAMLGAFRENPKTRAEFLSFIDLKR